MPLTTCPMNALHRYAHTSRRKIEPIMSIGVLALALLWFLEVAIPFRAELFFSYILLPSTLLVPAALGIIAVASSALDVVDVIRALIGDWDTWQGVLCIVRLALSGLILVVAGNVIFYGVASYYVIYFGDPGGVLLHPYVVLGIGGVLGLILVVRSLCLPAWNTAIFGSETPHAT